MGAGDCQEHNGRIQQREGNVPEHRPTPCSVQPSGFVVNVWDRVQARQEDNNLKAEVVPDIYHHNRRQRLRRALQKWLGRNAQDADELVDAAALRLVQPPPDPNPRRPVT